MICMLVLSCCGGGGTERTHAAGSVTGMDGHGNVLWTFTKYLCASLSTLSLCLSMLLLSPPRSLLLACTCIRRRRRIKSMSRYFYALANLHGGYGLHLTCDTIAPSHKFITHIIHYTWSHVDPTAHTLLPHRVDKHTKSRNVNQNSLSGIAHTCPSRGKD